MPENIDEKNIIEQGVSQKEFSPDSLKAYAQENIEKYVNEKLTKLEEKMNEKIEKKETKTTEMLAIFITLFTFISVNITIFTKVSDIKRAVFFMILMVLCSATLVSFLFISINSDKKNIFQWIALLFSLGLMILILFGVHFIPIWNITL
ncbi:MAG: hypothetical protein WC087_04135 [Candidatus Paceibacterota bacterium]